MLIPKSSQNKNGIRNRTINREIKIGPVSIKFVAIALLAVSALFYLAQSTQASAQKYKIMQLEDSRKQIQIQTRELEVEAARLKSLNTIKNTSQDLGLESVNSKTEDKENKVEQTNNSNNTNKKP